MPTVRRKASKRVKKGVHTKVAQEAAAENDSHLPNEDEFLLPVSEVVN